MAATKKQLINLLPQEEFASSTLGRFLGWVLSTFRVIVIITEVVVMGAFLSRFYLDARITNLNQEIKEKRGAIESKSEFEKKFRGKQAKIRIASEMLADEAGIMSELNSIASYTPDEVSLSSFTFRGSNTSIKALTPGEAFIAQLITNLNASGKFGKIELTDISTTESVGMLSFSVTIDKK